MEQIFTGKTPEEAVEAGLKELALTREDVEIEVLEEGKKKLFGSIPAKVKLTVKENLTDGQRAVRFLEGLLPLLGSEAAPTLASEDEKIIIQLETETAKGIIGRRGEMIDAIQTLAGAVANTGRKDYKRVVVDCGNYREEREKTLRRVAEKLAQKAVRLGKRVRLEPMNPYERRIIHAAVSEIENATSRSVGEEPYRKVLISSTEKRENRGRRDGKGGDRNSRGRKGGRRREEFKARSLDISSSFEKDYKKPKPEDEIGTGLYSKIEF